MRLVGGSATRNGVHQASFWCWEPESHGSRWGSPVNREKEKGRGPTAPPLRYRCLLLFLPLRSKERLAGQGCAADHDHHHRQEQVPSDITVAGVRLQRGGR